MSMYMAVREAVGRGYRVCDSEPLIGRKKCSKRPFLQSTKPASLRFQYTHAGCKGAYPGLKPKLIASSFGSLANPNR